MENEKRPAVFWKRFLALFIIFISTIFLAYSCSSIQAVSYNMPISDLLGAIYESEDQNIVLLITSQTQAHLTTDDEELAGNWTMEKKDNLLVLIREVEDEETGELITGQETRFLAVSHEDLFWQNENIFLFRWEENLNA